MSFSPLSIFLWRNFNFHARLIINTRVSRQPWAPSRNVLLETKASKSCKSVWCFKACTLKGAGSCCGDAVLSGDLPAGGLTRGASVPPAGQNLPVEPEGRQDHRASVLALGSEGAVDPFFHPVRGRAGAEADPLRGRPVSPHHAHGWGHVAGRHQELTSSAAHGCC